MVVEMWWNRCSENRSWVRESTFAAEKFRGYGETIVTADFDNDGDVDIFIPQYVMAGSRGNPRNYPLLLENASGKFIDRSLLSGFEQMPVKPEGAFALDFNEDGWIDIYTASTVWFSRGDLSFVGLNRSIGLGDLLQDEGALFAQIDDDLNYEVVRLSPSGCVPALHVDSATNII